MKEQILMQLLAPRSPRKLLREVMSLRKERLRTMNSRLNTPRTNPSHGARALKKKRRGVEIRVDGRTDLPRVKELPPDHQLLSGMTCPHSFLLTTHLLGQDGTVPWRLLTPVTCPQPTIHPLYLLQPSRCPTLLSTGFPPCHPTSPLCMAAALLLSSNVSTGLRREHMGLCIERGTSEPKRLSH